MASGYNLNDVMRLKMKINKEYGVNICMFVYNAQAANGVFGSQQDCIETG